MPQSKDAQVEKMLKYASQKYKTKPSQQEYDSMLKSFGVTNADIQKYMLGTLNKGLDTSIQENPKTTTMNKYKIVKNVTMNGITVFVVGDIVEGIELPANSFGEIYIKIKLNKELTQKLNGIDIISIITESPKNPVKVEAVKISDGENTDQIENTNTSSDLMNKAKNIQIGGTIVLWGIFAFLSYKYWNKSNIWKAMIVSFGAYNAYNTYKVFKK